MYGLASYYNETQKDSIKAIYKDLNLISPNFDDADSKNNIPNVPIVKGYISEMNDNDVHAKMTLY